MRACALLPSAYQSRQPVRSGLSRQKPPLNLYSLFECPFLRRGMPMSVFRSCSLLIQDHTVLFLFALGFFFVCFHFSFRTVHVSREAIPFPSIHTASLAFRFLQPSGVHRTQYVLQFFARFLPGKITLQLSLLWFVPLFFVAYAFAYAVC